MRCLHLARRRNRSCCPVARISATGQRFINIPHYEAGAYGEGRASLSAQCTQPTWLGVRAMRQRRPVHARSHAGQWVGDEKHGDGAEAQTSDPEKRIQTEDRGGDSCDAQDDHTGGGPEVSFQGVETEVEYRGGNQTTEDGHAKSADELLGAECRCVLVSCG